jgi:hypothetical protein
MGTDYEIMQNTADEAEEIIAKAGRLLVRGEKLSAQSLSSGESAATYENFLQLIDQTRKISLKHHFGHYKKIDELEKFERHTWDELLARARFLLGIAKEFQLRLQFTRVTKNEDEQVGLDDADGDWEDDLD